MIYLDNRSARLERTSGWERVARNLDERVPAEVVRGVGSADSIVALLRSDWVELPRISSQFDVMHFPTFAPTRQVKPRRLLYTLHDLTPWRVAETMSRGNRLYHSKRMASAVQREDVFLHVLTPTIAEEAHEMLGVPWGRLFVIPNGVSLRPHAPGRLRSRPYLLCIATNEPRKNLDRLVTAYSMSGLAPETELVIVGRDGWGRHKALVPGVVRVVDADDNVLAALLAHAAALVSVSLYEGFGLPVAEALCSGVPVICSEIGAHRDVAGDQALYVDPLDVDDIRRGLRQYAVLDKPDATEAQGRFSWPATVSALVELYAELSP